MFKITKGINTIVVLADHTISTTRIINCRVCRVLTKVDGTIMDLNKKINAVTMLDDEMFEEFARIQLEADDAS